MTFTDDLIGLLVARGADHLDATLPGWHRRVMRTKLDLRCNLGCVLGQLYGHLTDGVAHVPLKHRLAWLAWHGFWWDKIEGRWEPHQEDVAAAHWCWRNQIKRRLADDRMSRSSSLF